MPNSNIKLKLMTHVVMGYPSLEATVDRVRRMVDAGVSMIELQIPFSDPLADGPAITAANQQALTKGITVEQCFEFVGQATKQYSIPFILIGYYNTVLRYGVERFMQRAKQVGVAGLTFPDMPLTEESYEHFYALAKQYALSVIPLVSPASTSERLQAVSAEANYYIYCVARFGVTGSGSVQAGLNEYIKRVRQYTNLPLAIGFGIRTPEQIQQLHGQADIAVVGSALLPYDGEELTRYLATLCHNL